MTGGTRSPVVCEEPGDDVELQDSSERREVDTDA